MRRRKAIHTARKLARKCPPKSSGDLGYTPR